MSSLRAQEHRGSDTVTAVVSHGNRIANSILPFFETPPVPHATIACSLRVSVLKRHLKNHRLSFAKLVSLEDSIVLGSKTHCDTTTRRQHAWSGRRPSDIRHASSSAESCRCSGYYVAVLASPSSEA